MLIERPKTSLPAARTARDRLIDAGFHVSVALLAAAILLVFAFVLLHR